MVWTTKLNPDEEKEIKLVRFTLRGTTPLLMNNPEKTLGLGEEGGKGKISTGTLKEFPPEEEAKIRRYLTPERCLCIPAESVFQALRTACAGYMVKVEGRGSKIALRPVLSGAISLVTPVFPLMDENREFLGENDYEIDIRRVVIKQSAIPRCRPKVFPWLVICEYRMDFSRFADKEGFERVILRAGMYPGLLDYRPENSGTFGKYEPIDIEYLDFV